MEVKGIHIHPTAFVHPTAVLEGNIQIGAYSEIGPNSVLTGNITIGTHSWLLCGIVIRGSMVIIGNYVNIYDLVNIEGGRPQAPLGSSTAKEKEIATIGDYCWINHAAVMHGTLLGEEAAVGGNTFCDYGTKVEKGAILGNGSATNVGQIISANTLAEGVPAKIVKSELTFEDRQNYFGLHPKTYCLYVGERAQTKAYQDARTERINSMQRGLGQRRQD